MEQNNNENISDLLSISIEMDEEMEKKKEKEEERKRKNREATLRCRKEKKEKKEKRKKYNKLYKGVKELAQFNNKNEKEIKKELGIKTNRHLVNLWEKEDYERQESLRDRTRHRQEMERIFGGGAGEKLASCSVSGDDNNDDEELKKFYRNQRRRINYAQRKENMLALFAQDKNKKEKEEIIKEDKLREIRMKNQEKKMPEIIASIHNYCNDPDRWAKEKEKEEEEKKKKEKELLDFFKKFNFGEEKKQKKEEKKPEKEEKKPKKEEKNPEKEPENPEEEGDVDDSDSDQPTFKEENGEFVVLNNKKFFAKINKNQLFNQKK